MNASQGWGLPGQRRAVLAFIESKQGLRLARRRVADCHLPGEQANDIRQEAWLAAAATFAGPNPPCISSPEHAERYGAEVIRNQVSNLLRAHKRRPEGHVAGRADNPPDLAYEQHAGDGDLEGVILATSPDDFRRAVWRRFLVDGVACQGGPALPVAVALALITRLCDPYGPDPDVETETKGGATPFARAMYAALASIDPVRFARPDGGHTEAARQAKGRLDPCVRRLLLDAVDDVRSATQ